MAGFGLDRNVKLFELFHVRHGLANVIFAADVWLTYRRHVEFQPRNSVL